MPQLQSRSQSTRDPLQDILNALSGPSSSLMDILGQIGPMLFPGQQSFMQKAQAASQAPDMSPIAQELATELAMGFTPAGSMEGKKFLPGPQTIEEWIQSMARQGEKLRRTSTTATLRNPKTGEVATGGTGMTGGHPWSYAPGFTERGFIPSGLPAKGTSFLPDYAAVSLGSEEVMKQMAKKLEGGSLIDEVFRILKDISEFGPPRNR